MIMMSFLSITQAYIPYSEPEMGDFLKDKKVPRSFEETKLHMAGYSDIVLVPDTRYGVKNSQILELKYIKDKEDPKEKIKEATEQIKRYEQDEKFQRLAAGTKIYKYIILAYKDRVEILEE